ncbi:DUF6714 family protein [Kangiella sp.]|uniref:DUF6714 family protein n=1 Tax=Kangiella sp. TaxID=1920245 RepID=UPI003A92AA9E
MSKQSMDWVGEAKRLFHMEKPRHFTDYKHCDECEEHDQTLINSTIDTISLDELGSPGWDPLCFATAEGKKYYMPSLIRLSLETMNNEFYFGQFLFHLEADGKGNELYMACNSEQRELIKAFVEYAILNYAEQLEDNGYQNEALKVQEIWSNA